MSRRYAVMLYDHEIAYPPRKYYGAGDTPEQAFADAMETRRQNEEWENKHEEAPDAPTD